MCQRAGMLSRAKELCIEMGQPWRAATLVGKNDRQPKKKRKMSLEYMVHRQCSNYMAVFFSS